MLPEKQRIGLAKGQAEPPGREETQVQQQAETVAEATQELLAEVHQKRGVIILKEEVLVLEVLPAVPVIPGPPLLPAVEVGQIKALAQEVPAHPEVVEVVENLQAQGEVRHGI